MQCQLLDASEEVKEGDIVTIDFEGFVDGEQFPGGTGDMS